MRLSVIILELYTDSVFWYEPFGIFLVFSYRIPKGNSVGNFGIIKLAGALDTHGDHTPAPSQRENSPPHSFSVWGGRRLQLVKGARMLNLLYEHMYGKPTIG